jgi:HlyD family secretion protein
MKRWIVILLVIGAIASTWVIYAQTRNGTDPSVPEGITTAQIARSSFEASINATGSMAAERSQSVVFGTSGRVTEVLVSQGDVVTEGQLLARLDVQDLELSLRQAEAALAVSEAQLARASSGPAQQDVVAARAAVAAAQANLSDLRRGPSDQDRERAQLSLDQARNSLWAAQGSRDATAGNPMASGGAITQAEASIANAELAVRIAEIQLEQLNEPPKASAIRAAEQQLAQAEANLARLLSSPAPEDLTVAEAQVSQARISVDMARHRLSQAELTAPMNGELTSWNIKPGDQVSPGAPVGMLLDTGSYYLDVQVDETNIGRVRAGQPVRIALDAFPETRVEGEVRSVNLVGTASQGIVTYGVRINVSSADLPVRPLMTGAVEIVVDSREHVLIVPSRALRRDRDGVYVEVLRNNVPSRADILIGASNETMTEVLEGLAENDTVIVTRPRQGLFTSPFGG